MTVIQIMSDLHIECMHDDINPLNFITPTAKILILAGDIGSFYRIDQLRQFLAKLCPYFYKVLYIPGNHEWYTLSDILPEKWEVLEQRMYDLQNDIPNLRIMNSASVLIGDLCIIGTTLWSDPCGHFVPPFIVRINGMSTRKYQDKHKDNLEYIEKMLKYCKEKKYKTLVVTHHPPTEKVLSIKKKYSFLYATNLDRLLNKDDVQTWVCGHTHRNFDLYTENGCRVVSNQKGKSKDNVQDFRKDFILDL